MTNGERYRTAQERNRAFEEFCFKSGDCIGCIAHTLAREQEVRCSYAWLDMEADEEKKENEK